MKPAALILVILSIPVALTRDGESMASSRMAAEEPGTATRSEERRAGVVGEADAAFDRGEYRRARSLYRRAVEIHPDNPHALRRLALLQTWEGELKRAAASYERALALEPDDVELALTLADILTRMGEPKRAIPLYEKLRAVDPTAPRILFGLGRALIQDGRLDDARALYQEMEKGKIEPIAAHMARARVLILQDSLERARGIFGEALRADPGNLQARLGIAEVNHLLGLNRAALAQVDDIVTVHPEDPGAARLQQDIHHSLAPRAHFEGERVDDDDGTRSDAASARVRFMAEPQTAIDIEFATLNVTSQCRQLSSCDEVAVGPVVDQEVEARAQILMAQLTSLIIRSLKFNAWIGLIREEDFGGGDRVLGIGGGYLRWDVGSRLALLGRASREPLIDTAILIDRGIRVDAAEGRIEYRIGRSWRLYGMAGYAIYSDDNDRTSGDVGIEWRLRSYGPSILSRVDLQYRSFAEDLDHGYFDPDRYTAGLLTVAIRDAYSAVPLYWHVEGTYGRQDIDAVPGATLEGENNDEVEAIRARVGIKFSSRATLEAYYTRSNYPFDRAVAFTYTRAGFDFRWVF